jgi:hypothetical protein
MDEYDRDTLKRASAFKNKLTNYDFSTITIKDYPIDVACEVFSRINTGGKSLTVFEIMVAKTYDEKLGFDLAEKYELLRDGSMTKESPPRRSLKPCRNQSSCNALRQYRARR